MMSLLSSVSSPSALMPLILFPSSIHARISKLSFLLSSFMIVFIFQFGKDVEATITVHPSAANEETTLHDSFPADFGTPFGNRTFNARLILPMNYNVDPYLCRPQPSSKTAQDVANAKKRTEISGKMFLNGNMNIVQKGGTRNRFLRSVNYHHDEMNMNFVSLHVNKPPVLQDAFADFQQQLGMDNKDHKSNSHNQQRKTTEESDVNTQDEKHKHYSPETPYMHHTIFTNDGKTQNTSTKQNEIGTPPEEQLEMNVLNLPLAFLVKRGECTFVEKARNAMTITFPPYVYKQRTIFQPVVKFLVVYNYDNQEDFVIMDNTEEVEKAIEDISIGLMFVKSSTGAELVSMINIVEFYASKDDGIDGIVDDEHARDDDDMAIDGPYSDILPLSSLGGMLVDLDGEIPIDQIVGYPSVINDNISEPQTNPEPKSIEETFVNDIDTDKTAISFFLANLHWYLLALILTVPLLRWFHVNFVRVGYNSDNDDSLNDAEDGGVQLHPLTRGDMMRGHTRRQSMPRQRQRQQQQEPTNENFTLEEHQVMGLPDVIFSKKRAKEENDNDETVASTVATNAIHGSDRSIATRSLERANGGHHSLERDLCTFDCATTINTDCGMANSLHDDVEGFDETSKAGEQSTITGAFSAVSAYFDQDVCAVCLEEFEDGEKLKALSCDHIFHVNCIMPWLTTRMGICPLCKDRVSDHQSNDEEEKEEPPVEPNPNNNVVQQTGAFSQRRRSRRSSIPADSSEAPPVVAQQDEGAGDDNDDENNSFPVSRIVFFRRCRSRSRSTRGSRSRGSRSRESADRTSSNPRSRRFRTDHDFDEDDDSEPGRSRVSSQLRDSVREHEIVEPPLPRPPPRSAGSRSVSSSSHSSADRRRQRQSEMSPQASYIRQQRRDHSRRRRQYHGRSRDVATSRAPHVLVEIEDPHRILAASQPSTMRNNHHRNFPSQGRARRHYRRSESAPLEAIRRDQGHDETEHSPHQSLRDIGGTFRESCSRSRRHYHHHNEGKEEESYHGSHMSPWYDVGNDSRSWRLDGDDNGSLS